MNIALIGYGKMGKAIEDEAQEKGHKVVLKINTQNSKELTIENLKIADVAIEFTTPSTVLSNIQLCFQAQVPLVVGTTGWYEQLDSVRTEQEKHHAALFYASNFSVGVNIFFRINEMIARAMGDFSDYEPTIEETHHIQKLDSPSGTAITLAERILPFLEVKKKWKNILQTQQVSLTEQGHRIEQADHTEQDDLLIYSEREGDVKGIHKAVYTSKNDKLVFVHEALSRRGFAQGAVMAAEWVKGKAGIFTMDDMLGDIYEEG